MQRMQMLDLEKQFQTRLFDRVKKQLEGTDTGALL